MHKIILLGNRSRPTTQSGGSSAIKESGDSNSATIDDTNDIERIDRLSKWNLKCLIYFYIINVCNEINRRKKVNSNC